MMLAIKCLLWGKVKFMNFKEFISQEDSLEEGLFNRDNYEISKKTDKLIRKLEKRKKEINDNPKSTEEDKKVAKAIEKAIPVIESFKKYFIKLESDLYDTADEEKRKLIEAKYDDIKTLFINQLYKIMEIVSYRPSIMIASLIAWIIIVTATPFTNWMLIPTYLTLKSISKNKKKITNRNFSKELSKLTDELMSKKRMQYRSYKKETGIQF